ncbi:MAG: hypothetical protein ACK5L3_11470 [Oscillospiraceae bacterium]
MTFVKLLSPSKYKNKVAAAFSTGLQLVHVGGKWEYIRLIDYFFDEGPFFGEYEEISESEAIAIVGRKSVDDCKKRAQRAG